jgi:hypothetical protein
MVEHSGSHCRATMTGQKDNFFPVTSEGWRWRSGEADSDLVLPTFIHAVRRKPAGIERCCKQTLQLRREEMRHPPYT